MTDGKAECLKVGGLQTALGDVFYRRRKFGSPVDVYERKSFLLGDGKLCLSSENGALWTAYLFGCGVFMYVLSVVFVHNEQKNKKTKGKNRKINNRVLT